MNPAQHFDYLQGRFVGRPIQFFRLVIDTLLLYVDCEPGQDGGWVIWVEPTWQFSGPEGVLVGSGQALGESGEGLTLDEMKRIGAPLNRLLRVPVTRLEWDARTGDLILEVGGDLLVRTFASDISDDDLWMIRDRERRIELKSTSRGLITSEPTN